MVERNHTSYLGDSTATQTQQRFKMKNLTKLVNTTSWFDKRDQLTRWLTRCSYSLILDNVFSFKFGPWYETMMLLMYLGFVERGCSLVKFRNRNQVDQTCLRPLPGLRPRQRVTSKGGNALPSLQLSWPHLAVLQPCRPHLSSTPRRGATFAQRGFRLSSTSSGTFTPACAVRSFSKAPPSRLVSSFPVPQPTPCTSSLVPSGPL